MSSTSSPSNASVSFTYSILKGGKAQGFARLHPFAFATGLESEAKTTPDSVSMLTVRVSSLSEQNKNERFVLLFTMPSVGFSPHAIRRRIFMRGQGDTKESSPARPIRREELKMSSTERFDFELIDGDEDVHIEIRNAQAQEGVIIARLLDSNGELDRKIIERTDEDSDDPIVTRSMGSTGLALRDYTLTVYVGVLAPPGASSDEQFSVTAKVTQGEKFEEVTQADNFDNFKVVMFVVKFK